MKVFFLASARTQRTDLGKQIYHLIEELGHTHLSDFILTYNRNKFYEVSDQEWYRRYKKWTKAISKADVCIFECSLHSLAVGQLVQESIRQEKPVVVLHPDEFKPHFLVATSGNERKLLLLQYNMGDISEVVKYALSESKELTNSRFTLVLPPDILTHLNKISEKGLSRSEYIRSLIRKDMNS